MNLCKSPVDRLYYQGIRLFSDRNGPVFAMLRGLIILPFTGGALLFDVPRVMPDRVTPRLAKLRPRGGRARLGLFPLR
jgi:hypothetical protein